MLGYYKILVKMLVLRYNSIGRLSTNILISPSSSTSCLFRDAVKLSLKYQDRTPLGKRVLGDTPPRRRPRVSPVITTFYDRINYCCTCLSPPRCLVRLVSQGITRRPDRVDKIPTSVTSNPFFTLTVPCICFYWRLDL